MAAVRSHPHPIESTAAGHASSLQGRGKGGEEDASGIGCEICCTDNVPTSDLVQRSSGHLFCKQCVGKMAESQIGMRRSALPCMAMEGCANFFEASEARRFLDPATFRLLERIQTEEEIRTAGLEGLEGCPFCDYACVIENEDEKLFRCVKEGCAKLSCRLCKQLDHLPKSCAEYDIEVREQSVHRAEELLSAVLMRRCPQPGCNTPLVKEDTVMGCNKMTCTVCKRQMCYCCRKDITHEGYRHFNMQADGNTREADKEKCLLWEDTMELHRRDVEEARLRLGEVAPERTRAEGEDEARRRRQYERRARAAEEPFLGGGFVDDGERHDDPQDPPLHQRLHDIIMLERNRQAQLREARHDRQEREDVARRGEMLRERENRLEILGFSLAARVLPWRPQLRPRLPTVQLADLGASNQARAANNSLPPRPHPFQQHTYAAPTATSLTETVPPPLQASLSVPPRVQLPCPRRPGPMTQPRPPARRPPVASRPSPVFAPFSRPPDPSIGTLPRPPSRPLVKLPHASRPCPRPGPSTARTPRAPLCLPPKPCLSHPPTGCPTEAAPPANKDTPGPAAVSAAKNRLSRTSALIQAANRASSPPTPS